MAEPQLKRPFQQRFLDGFDRSQLRAEVESVKPKKLKGWRKKYATWALGASLAFGGIGAPLRMMQHDKKGDAGSPSTPSAAAAAPATGLEGDLDAAKQIADQVAGGVQAAVSGVEDAAKAPLEVVKEAPKQLSMISDTVREQFFKKEVPFGSIILQEAKKNNLRPELIAAVVQAESKFHPTARSGAGAIGLMQLVPKTGRWMGARDLTNPAQNISAGAKYLKYLHDRFDGNETKVIAAYNAGEGNVKRFGGVPPFQETRKYVAKVRNYEQEFRNRVDGRVADQVAEAR